MGVLCACDVVGVALRDRWNRTPMDMAPDEECRAMLRNRGKEFHHNYIYDNHLDCNLNGQNNVVVVSCCGKLVRLIGSDIETWVT